MTVAGEILRGVIVASICRHCAKANVSRPRGLCWSCYYTPGVKEQYGMGCRRGLGIGVSGHTLPTPTDTLPGTAERLAVLQQRAARGERLWHPNDARA